MSQIDKSLQNIISEGRTEVWNYILKGCKTVKRKPSLHNETN